MDRGCAGKNRASAAIAYDRAGVLRPVSIALLVLCVSACALLLSVVIRVAEFEAIELDRWSDETSLEDAVGAPEPIAIEIGRAHV